ncbi:hypothetical protein JG687_00013634 [Phytophthora cactorum]|uniref:BZIP domain-containing protein n=1 Tax=Phytophthora cactorum TaxID=29920 RepID=A0A329S592_9STRA|nr:hypothetical protein GQ600_2361 [Phytophthora cactorum]KAG2782869.1 hypothetical protein Pcac1_g7389 [Phytophthora cactorum]KAG2807875.1 hypothetical protein PC111_g16734 [Phytophthora cactorum]KAG2824661.1 hypothetical protein PC112_g10033 [Phytophthora cactorum]KAG2858244.1 hypothetical protein PC113_g9989 [Phytophthora cactorum]
MTSSSLYPPNIQDLSDTVISSVRQHAKRDSKVFSVHEIHSQTLNAAATNAIMAINGQELQKTETSVDQDQEYTDPVGYRRLLRRRQIRRDIQRRYRAKVHARSVAFENSVERLKDEVRRLVQQCRHLSTDPLSTTTPWNIVAEYFALFRHGFNSFSTASVVSEPSPSSKQLMFLLGTMASSVMVKSGSGIPAMLGIWRSISRRYDGLDVRLVRLENDPEGSFIATTKCYFTITQSMLLQEFPHLVTEEGKLPPLAEKLLGQQIVLPSGARFDWDESTGRMAAVTGRNFKAEMLTPLLKILGNLEDVAFVLG